MHPKSNRCIQWQREQRKHRSRKALRAHTRVRESVFNGAETHKNSKGAVENSSVVDEKMITSRRKVEDTSKKKRSVGAYPRMGRGQWAIGRSSISIHGCPIGEQYYWFLYKHRQAMLKRFHEYIHVRRQLGYTAGVQLQLRGIPKWATLNWQRQCISHGMWKPDIHKAK